MYLFAAYVYVLHVFVFAFEVFGMHLSVGVHVLNYGRAYNVHMNSNAFADELLNKAWEWAQTVEPM